MGNSEHLFTDYDPSIVGDRIAAERKALRMSQDKFVAAYGEKLKITTRRTLSKIEGGDQNTDFTVWQLLEFCRIFQCDMGYLLGEYDCHSRKATDICKETGLSEDAVKVLHFMTQKDEDYNQIGGDYLSNKATLDFLSMVLGADVRNTERQGTLTIVNLFYDMALFVRSSNAAVASYETENNGERITIDCGDGNMCHTLAVGELYREHLFSNIRKNLDYFRDAFEKSAKREG